MTQPTSPSLDKKRWTKSWLKLTRISPLKSGTALFNSPEFSLSLWSHLCMHLAMKCQPRAVVTVKSWSTLKVLSLKLNCSKAETIHLLVCGLRLTPVSLECLPPLNQIQSPSRSLQVSASSSLVMVLSLPLWSPCTVLMANPAGISSPTTLLTTSQLWLQHLCCHLPRSSTLLLTTSSALVCLISLKSIRMVLRLRMLSSHSSFVSTHQASLNSQMNTMPTTTTWTNYKLSAQAKFSTRFTDGQPLRNSVAKNTWSAS